MKVLKKTEKKNKRVYWREMYRELLWMYGHIKKYRLWILFYMVVGAVGTVFSLGVSVISKQLIDVVLGHQTQRLSNLAACMAGLAVGSILTNAGISRISARVMVDVQNKMRRELYSKILCSKWEELQLYSTGDLLNRINSDMGIVSGNVISWLPALVTKGFRFLGALGIMLYYDKTMAVLALVSAPLTMALSRVLMGKMRAYNKEMREISSDMMAFQNDSFQNLQTLKAFGLMKTFSGKMENMQDRYRMKLMDYNRFQIFISSYMSAAGMAVSYLCFGWSIYRMWGGYITPGTMAMFVQLASGLASSFSGLVHMVPSLIRTLTSAGRIMELEALEKESGKDAKAKELLEYTGPLKIRMEDVTACYKNEAPVFENSGFAVSSGEIVALVGASGEGKTTFIRLLLGVLEPVKGSLEFLWEGQKSCRLSAGTRGCFSYVPQGNTLFMGTIEENLRLVKPQATEEEIEKALKDACAWDFVMEFPEGIKHYIGERGTGISEGQAQRLAIARAILRNAPVLLLDEATSALDMETEREVLEHIVKSDERKLCIITTHRPSVLAMCHRIYEVKDKKLCLKIKKDENN